MTTTTARFGRKAASAALLVTSLGVGAAALHPAPAQAAPCSTLVPESDQFATVTNCMNYDILHGTMTTEGALGTICIGAGATWRVDRGGYHVVGATITTFPWGRGFLGAAPTPCDSDSYVPSVG